MQASTNIVFTTGEFFNVVSKLTLSFSLSTFKYGRNLVNKISHKIKDSKRKCSLARKRIRTGDQWLALVSRQLYYIDRGGIVMFLLLKKNNLVSDFLLEVYYSQFINRSIYLLEKAQRPLSNDYTISSDVSCFSLCLTKIIQQTCCFHNKLHAIFGELVDRSFSSPQ